MEKHQVETFKKFEDGMVDYTRINFIADCCKRILRSLDKLTESAYYMDIDDEDIFAKEEAIQIFNEGMSHLSLMGLMMKEVSCYEPMDYDIALDKRFREMKISIKLHELIKSRMEALDKRLSEVMGSRD